MSDNIIQLNGQVIKIEIKDLVRTSVVRFTSTGTYSQQHQDPR